MHNKIIIHLVLFSLVIFTVSSCCNKDNTNSGKIISDFEIQNYNIYTDQSCLNIPDTICIRYDTTFTRIFKTDCKGPIIPHVDFTKNSLLIYQKHQEGIVLFHRDVKFDTIAKIVKYTINFSKCFCYDKCETNDYNMIIVPRIPDNYKIVYK
jgi:hypothetical protein